MTLEALLVMYALVVNLLLFTQVQIRRVTLVLMVGQTQMMV